MVLSRAWAKMSQAVMIGLLLATADDTCDLTAAWPPSSTLAPSLPAVILSSLESIAKLVGRESWSTHRFYALFDCVLSGAYFSLNPELIDAHEVAQPSPEGRQDELWRAVRPGHQVYQGLRHPQLHQDHHRQGSSEGNLVRREHNSAFPGYVQLHHE